RHVRHGDVAVADILHDAAAADVGFDAETVLGIHEGAILHDHIANAADGFTADAHAMPVQECAIGHCDVFALEIVSRSFLFGFDRDIIVAYVNAAFRD